MLLHVLFFYFKANILLMAYTVLQRNQKHFTLLHKQFQQEQRGWSSHQISVAQSSQWNDELRPYWIDVVADVLCTMYDWKSKFRIEESE